MIEFDCTLGTDTEPEIPREKVVIMVATGLENNACQSLMAGHAGVRDEYAVQGMLDYIHRFGLVKAELKCDEEPSTMEIARHLGSRCKTTVLTESATPRGSEGSLGQCERADLSVQGQLPAPPAQLSKKLQN